MPYRRNTKDLIPSLVFLNGDLLAVPIPLERGVVTLGRAIGSNVRINDSEVARTHAQIVTIRDEETGEQGYHIEDLNSDAGTLINGRSVSKAVLSNGDKITIGKHILRFELLDEIDREYQLQIRRLLAHDDLTGLLSSRSFFSELRREASRAKHDNKKFCVLMMDVDLFKSVNDTYGHLTGSKTLEEIGNCITTTLRSGDVAARFGGEEFAAFLLDAELSQASVASERIRQSIEEFKFSIVKKGLPVGTHRITISIGISAFPDDSTDPIELVEMADSALYRAKNLGRNRVCVYKETIEGQMENPMPSREEIKEQKI